MRELKEKISLSQTERDEVLQFVYQILLITKNGFSSDWYKMRLQE